MLIDFAFVLMQVFILNIFWVVMERLKPECEAELEEVEADMKCKLEKVDWLPGFYSLPPSIQIANSKAYQQGKVRG